MANSPLEDFCSRPEDQWFDRKSWRIAPKDLARTLVAFANAEGGTVAVGITDTGNIEDPVSTEKENKLRVAAHDHTDPAVRVRISKLDSVLVFEVEPGERVHFTSDGRCYLRLGDKSVSLNSAQQQELRYSKGEQLFDTSPAYGACRSDLDDAAISRFAELIGSSSPDDALRARGLLTRDGEVSVAGLLLFGKNPQERFPNAEVRVLKYLDDAREVGARQQLESDKRFHGSLPSQLDDASRYIRSLLPTVSRFGTSGGFAEDTRIPDDAWMEGLVNAVIHRSYSLLGDHIRFEIFPSRIEISSPGRFPGLADPRDPETISRFARNPHIARVMTDLGIGQELGEGIRRIFAELRRVGFLDPEYQQTGGSVILQLQAVRRVTPSALKGMPQQSAKVLALLQSEPSGLGTGEVADRLHVSRPAARRVLKELQNATLVEWQGHSPRDPRARWIATPPLT
ncbi:RNA-binding domain-containing protein [Corynebacterium sp.]|uniref:RNA-binding domain-containing protein n=1 Tax=Corynebacterium sp. TaxID=1720 RepID=UPI002A90E4CA|nr:ATP-binding protein [Corynebacterium sp.]MDY5785250.1 ATP-binding protein [Corynebacterium sp.]